MNDVPLVKDNNINSINTSLIAVKKQLKQLTEAVGLIDVPDVDTSVFVKKSEVVDAVESGNMNPVTSNAVVPVDEVAVGNMQSVSSNAVAESLSYSTTEQKTGGYWVDGKPIYRLVVQGGNSVVGQWVEIGDMSAYHVDKMISMKGIVVTTSNNYWVDIGNYASGIHYNLPSAGKLSISVAWAGNYSLILEYTKTTD